MRSFGARAALVSAALVLMPAAVAGPYDTDRKGGADHPLVSRYQGSLLYMYGDEPVGAAQLLFKDKGKPVLRGVEGKVANRLYWGPKGRSPLEVFRNYQQALAAAGFETLFACDTAQCLEQNVQPMIANLPRTVKWIDNDNMVQSTFNSGSQPDFHYLSARKNGPAGPVYVQLALAGGFPDAPVSGRVRQFLEIIEPATVELGKVAVSAKAIGELLQRDGKIALYGVQFDTNKAVIRPESNGQLGEMAAALKAAPTLKAFVVGHTDNQGDFDANLALSHKRAQAVVDALTSKYGVAGARLSARGVANMAPVSSNRDEEGRAKNRRVELVAR